MILLLLLPIVHVGNLESEPINCRPKRHSLRSFPATFSSRIFAVQLYGRSIMELLVSTTRTVENGVWRARAVRGRVIIKLACHNETKPIDHRARYVCSCDINLLKLRASPSLALVEYTRTMSNKLSSNS